MLAPITIRYDFRPASPVAGDRAGRGPVRPRGVRAAAHASRRTSRSTSAPATSCCSPGRAGRGSRRCCAQRREQLGAVDASALELPDVPLIDALPGTIEDRLATLAGCGLSEARLLLRTPAELERGAAVSVPARVCAGEPRASATGFVSPATSSPRRSTGRWRRWSRSTCGSSSTRTGVGVLAATTHEDIVEDLHPDLWVRCGEGWIEAERRSWKSRARVVRGRAVAVGRHPMPTGRTSLGGITAGTASRSSAA